MIPAWLEEALRNRRLSVRKAQGPVSSDAAEYVLVLPLVDAIAFQNLMVGAVLANEEGELDNFNFDALGGASNALADFIEDPVQIRYEQLYPDPKEEQQ